MGRALIILTSLTGGVGLGLALAYFVLVVASFQPGGAAIAEFMVGTEDTNLRFGFALVVVPYLLLMVHLWLRANVARLLLERGDLDRARRFAQRGARAGLLRAPREALANRVVLMRLAMREGDYTGVEELAGTARLPRRGEAVVAFHRWRLEAALRRDNLVLGAEIVGQAWPFSQRGLEAASFCAAAGELAVRNADETAWIDWRDRATFAHPNCPRLDASAAFAAARFGADAAQARAYADRLAAATAWLDDVPLAAGEVAATRAALLQRAGQPDAREGLDAPLPCDARSEFVLARVRSDES